jgi:hypothetical protein
MLRDSRPPTDQTAWAGLLAGGAAVLSVAQLALVTIGLHVIDGISRGTPTSVYDGGLRLLSVLSWLELGAALAGMVVLATNPVRTRRGLLGGGFLVLTAVAVGALAARPAAMSSLLVEQHTYRVLFVLYAVGLPVATVTAGIAAWTHAAGRRRRHDAAEPPPHL